MRSVSRKKQFWNDLRGGWFQDERLKGVDAWMLRFFRIGKGRRIPFGSVDSQKHGRRGRYGRPVLEKVLRIHFAEGLNQQGSSTNRLQSRLSFQAQPRKTSSVNANFLQTDDHGLLAEVDLGVYSLTALLKVAYRFTDRCFLHLQRKIDRIVEVRFRSKSEDVPLDQIGAAFCNELLDQTLREIIGKESEPVRNLILAHALSHTSFVHPELEIEEPFAVSKNATASAAS
jgi:His-Xaa-Ser system protein HxsD